jgi:hypothetical protein
MKDKDRFEEEKDGEKDKHFEKEPNDEEVVVNKFYIPTFYVPTICDHIIEMQNHINEAIHPAIEIQKRFNETFKPLIELSKSIETITTPLNNIDWTLISEAVAEKIKEIDILLKEQEEDFWCLDVDILDAIEDGELILEELPEYVDKNLEAYIEELIHDPIFELHSTLIKETYEAYKSGFYKLCTFSLFAAFEHVVASWYVGNIKKELISIRIKPKVCRLYNKIKPIANDEKEQEQFIKVFTLSVLRIFKKTFVNIPDEPSKELNRNSLAHGFHDYDSLTKTDVLKLFQLLKSALILKISDPDEFKD